MDRETLFQWIIFTSIFIRGIELEFVVVVRESLSSPFTSAVGFYVPPRLGLPKPQYCMYTWVCDLINIVVGVGGC